MKRLALIGVALIFAAGCSNTGTGTTGPNPTKPGTKGSFKIESPKEESVKQGDTVKFKISVKRTNFNEPIRVEFDKATLPAGVSPVMPESTIKGDESSVEVTLKADEKATVENGKEVKVMAKAGAMEDSVMFKLDVKPK